MAEEKQSRKYRRKYPFLTANEARLVGREKIRMGDWFKKNHIEIYNKLQKNK